MGFVLNMITTHVPTKFIGYSVTSDGKVWSEKSRRYLTPFIDKDGYCIINLSLRKSNRKRVYVHRLIAQAFIPNVENKDTINHKNGIKTDNRVDNLEWMSIGDNVRHAWDNNLCRQGKAKYVLDTTTGVKYNTLRGAAKSVGIHFSTLSLMIRGLHKDKTNLIYVNK